MNYKEKFLLSLINDLEDRVSALEHERKKEERKRHFKRYVIIATDDQCYDVVRDNINGNFRDYIFKVKEFEHITVYHFKREYLDNGEVVIVKNEDFDIWKKGKKFSIIMYRDLHNIFEQRGDDKFG